MSGGQRVSEPLRSAVCRLIFDRLGRPDLWTANGSEPPAYEHAADLDEAPPMEKTLALAAWAIWRGHQGLTFADLLEADRAAVELMAGYLSASCYGDVGVNAWLAAKRRAKALTFPPSGGF